MIENGNSANFFEISRDPGNLTLISQSYILFINELVTKQPSFHHLSPGLRPFYN